MDQIKNHLEAKGWKGLVKIVIKKKIGRKKGHVVKRTRKMLP